MLFVFYIYLMKTAWYDQEDICSSCFLPYKESRFDWLASKGSIIPGESYPSVFILRAVSWLLKDPPDIFGLKSAVFAKSCTKPKKFKLKNGNSTDHLPMFCLLSMIFF